MHLVDYVLLVLATAAGLGAAGGGIMLALPSPRYRAVRAAFWFAALCFGGLGILWGSHSGAYPMAVRLLAAGSTAALAAISLTYMLSLISEHDAGQPNLSLELSKDKFDLVWDIARDTNLTTWKQGQPRSPNFFHAPGFVLKNSSPNIAYNVTVRWKAEVSGIPQLIKASSRLSSRKIEFANDRIDIYAVAGTTVANWTYNLALPNEQRIALLAREEEIYIPWASYPLMALYLIEKMPTQVGARTEPYLFTVSIEWNHPTGGKPQNYRIKVFLVNTNPAGASSTEITGSYEFEIQKL